MPGLIIFRRRWSVGSDDLVIPAFVLFIIHLILLIVLSLFLLLFDYHRNQCTKDLHDHTIGYMIILVGCVILEFFICWISMRGSILDTAKRSSMSALLYVRLAILIIEIIWLLLGSLWLHSHYKKCPSGITSDAIVVISFCNWLIVFFVLVTVWCTFDSAGRSWVKMKTYQNSMVQSKYLYKRSGSQRNWRQRKAIRDYQDVWNRRCRILFCCLRRSDRHQNSFTEIARLLSDFFRDIDVVPSDVIAGLILLRHHQKAQRKLIVNQRMNDTFQFLSGVAVTTETRFLDVTHKTVAEEIKTLIHYLRYAIAVYGWPLFMMTNSATGCFQLCPHLRCFRSFSCFSCMQDKDDNDLVINDNCCYCNYASLKIICKSHNYDIIYATYHVSVAEPPFFVAVDFDKQSIVISVRGTLSLQDIITDLNAEGEILPTNPICEEWLGHKGMVQAATYIKNKINEMGLLDKAFNYSPERGTQNYNLILVGHSLGAGTASILAILLREQYPNLTCFAFAPPGGLLSAQALEYTKEFIVSVVLGKDVVPRLGLHQMEALRFQLINCIKKSRDPKWNIIGSGIFCFGHKDEEFYDKIDDQSLIELDADGNKELASHPIDDSIALTVHEPLYPPGRIIHIVRNHPSDKERMVKANEPVYQAVWADNKNFNHILISPVMIQDHLPDKLLEALESLLTNTGPAKPQRQAVTVSNSSLCNIDTVDPVDSTHHRLMLETSFANSQMNGVKSKKPNQLNLVANTKKVDLLRDDWLGAAPLASPETLSDASCTSSTPSTNLGQQLLAWNLNYDSAMICPSSDHEYQFASANSFVTSQQNNHLNIPFQSIDVQTNSSLISDQTVNFQEGSSKSNYNKFLQNKSLKDKMDSYSYSPDDNARNEGSCDEVDCLIDASDDKHKALHHSLSDSDLPNLQPSTSSLLRSREKMNINNLDDSTAVFDASANNEEKASPNLEILFNKLLTIESPISESLIQIENTDFDSHSSGSNIVARNYL